jgi:uncharacterized protein YggE
MNDLLERLDERGINNVNIASYTHTDIKTYEKELKLQALKNAKEKAGFLLNGIDEKMGSVLEVNDIEQHPVQPVMYRAQAMEMANDAGYQSDLEFKTIKIKAAVRAVFGIDD